jgi:FMN phosphatase YigB (HAD superfamily)
MKFILENDKAAFWDVDDTLIMYDWPEDKAHEVVMIGVTPEDKIAVWPHKEHIKRLTSFKARGQSVVVWSQGGWYWAKTVVEALGIQDYVDVVMTKPRWYFDDLASHHWLTDRSYIDPVTGKTLRGLSEDDNSGPKR